MRIKRKIHFFLRYQTTRTGKRKEALSDLSIILELAYCSKRIRLATGLFSDADLWDENKEMVTAANVTSNKSAAEINFLLESMKGKIDEAFTAFEEKGIIPQEDAMKKIVIFVRDQATGNHSKDEESHPLQSHDFETEKTEFTTDGMSKEKLQQATKVVTKEPLLIKKAKKQNEETEKIVKEKETSEDFWETLNKFVENNSKSCSWSEKTGLKFQAMKNHMLNYREHVRKNTGDKHYDISFDYWDEDYFNDFLTFLFDVEDLYNPTVDKMLQLIRWFFRWAEERGFNRNDYYKHFHPKLKMVPRKVIYLDRKELNKVINYKIPETKMYLYRVRDIFLFQCYTSLRYSDVANLRTFDVHDDYIEITTIKTNDTLKIELNKYSRALINKYKGIKFPNSKVFPVISNQRMNNYLKELCEYAGIDEKVRMTTYKRTKRFDTVQPKWKLIGTHCGRRTFVCNALSMGISPQIVMKWTGHNNYASMKPYIDISDEIKEKSMKKFDTIFEP